MAEVVDEAFRILETMEKGSLYSLEQLDCAKKVISSYPVEKIRKGSEKTAYYYVAASLWLTGYTMGEKYHQTYDSIAVKVIYHKLGVDVLLDYMRCIIKNMVKDPNVRKTLLKIYELYSKPEIPKGLIISDLF